jgi:aminoglycoside 3-N-acetyltransferase I
LEKFLDNPNNYLLLAYEGDEVAGMLVAYNLIKPDSRGKEMFIYELETKAQFRNKGVATSLLAKIKEIAIASGSYELWVLTESTNLAGNRLYCKLGENVIHKPQEIYNLPLP